VLLPEPHPARPRAPASATLSHEAVGFALVLAAGALLLFAGLGERDLWSPDEPRYGAIAEELRSFVHGFRGLVLLHSNGEVYTQKPPLYFWLAALAGAPGGRVTELAARVPSALAGLGTLLAVGWLGRSMFRAPTALLAPAVLLGVQGWLQHARSARLDALLTLFVTLAFAAAWRIDRGGDARRGRLLLHAAIGLGILTKGPVALVLPLLGVLAYLAWERRLATFGRFVSREALLLSLAPGVAWWAGAAALAPPGYADASLGENLFGRFFSGTAHATPAAYYLEALPRAFLPWTLLWPAIGWRYLTLRRAAARTAELRAWRFVLAALAAALVFFSLSAGKRSVYLLPLHPLLALACGAVLAEWLARGASAPRWSGRALAAVGVAVGAAALASLGRDRVGEVELPAAFGLVLAVGSALMLFLPRLLPSGLTERGALVAAAFCGLFMLELAVNAALYSALDVRNSPRALAATAAAATSPGGTIAVYRNDTLAAAIAYYVGRPVRDLRRPRDVAAFVAQGGATVVVDERRSDELAGAAQLRRVAEGRVRQRRFQVLVPAG